MSNFLLVVEGLMADGADAAMIVDETTFRGAVLGCIFEEPCTGYIWCDKHGWTPADEACVCDDCEPHCEKCGVEMVWERTQFGDDYIVCPRCKVGWREY